jgi:hypothetical protein
VRKVARESAFVAFDCDFPFYKAHLYAVWNLNGFGDFRQPHQETPC